LRAFFFDPLLGRDFFGFRRMLNIDQTNLAATIYKKFVVKIDSKAWKRGKIGVRLIEA